MREKMPAMLGEGQRGVQFLPAELGVVMLARKFSWLLGVNPGEKLKKLFVLPYFLESLEFVDILFSWRELI